MDVRCFFFLTAHPFWKPQIILWLLHQQQPSAPIAASETRGAESAALCGDLPQLHHWQRGWGDQGVCPACSKCLSHACETSCVSDVSINTASALNSIRFSNVHKSKLRVLSTYCSVFFHWKHEDLITVTLYRSQEFELLISCRLTVAGNCLICLQQTYILSFYFLYMIFNVKVNLNLGLTSFRD